MTTVTGSGGVDTIFDSDDLKALSSGTLGAHDATAFTLSIPGQVTLTCMGTGFSYSGNHPSAGTITSLTLSLGFGTATWSDFSVSASTLWHAIANGDSTGFESLFFSGDDTFNLQDGAGGGDSVSGGAGNDTFNFTTFNDFNTIDGGAGNDTINVDGDFGFVTMGYVTNVETVHLGNDGHFYDLAIHPTTAETIDGTALTAGHSVKEDSQFFNSGAITLLGGAGDDTFVGGQGNDTFDGGAGSDTIDYSRATSAVTVNLNLTTGQAVGGGEGTDTLRNVENITGSTFNDTLTGNSADNVFEDGGGNNVIDGGGGSDTMSFQNMPLISGGTGVTIDLRPGQHGGTTGDTFTSVENFIGSGFGDTFIGDSNNNHFSGGGHNAVPDIADYSHASGGMVFTEASAVFTTYLSTNITASGADQGTDTLTDMSEILGTSGNDTFNMIESSATALDGGGGNDTLSFQNATAGINTSLGDSGGTTSLYSSIANLTGSAFADTLSGGVTPVVIHGGAGDDTIYGARGFASDGAPGATLYGDDGNDTIYGTSRGTDGNGNDVIYGGAGDDMLFTNDSNGNAGGDDTFDGGAGNDTITGGDGQNTVTYQDATGGVTVDLSQEDVRYTLVVNAGGGMGTDTLKYIQNLTGGDYADVLTGNEFDNTLNGGAGNDTLDISKSTGNNEFGPPGTGEDTVLGGTGDDLIIAGGDLDAGDKIDGGDGNDTLSLNGDYSAGFTFGATTMVNVETLQLAAGYSYKLTMDDANVAPGQTLAVDASALGAGDTLTFDGSHETKGGFVITGGAGNDVLMGGRGADTINGGGGIDTVSYIAANGPVKVDLTSTGPQAVGGGQGTDTLIAIEKLLGSNYNDTLTANSATTLLSGGNGNDTLSFGATMTASQTVDGGAGTDIAVLNGDYSAGAAFGASSLVSIETLRLTAGHSYDVVMNDGNVAAGATLLVDGSGLGASDKLTFDGSAETDGAYSVKGGAADDTFTGGAGNDVINGGAGHDTMLYTDATSAVTVSLALIVAQAIGGGEGSDRLIYVENVTGSNYDDTLTGNSGANVIAGGAGNDSLILTAGGNDTALGGDGDDTMAFGATLTVNDRIDGGAGNDTLTLNGDYSTNLTFASVGLFGVETILLGAGHNYNLTMNDANVAAGATLTMNGSKLGATDTLIFDGSHEKDGTFVIKGGAGNDTLTGGAGNDTITGGLGADVMAGGAGSDHFAYVHAAESTGAGFDTITKFDAAQDAIDLTGTITGVNTAVSGGTLSAATFDSDLAAAIGSGQLATHHAVLFTANAGSYAGDTFLIIDANNVAGYQAGQDFVIRLDQGAHLTSLTTANFI
ncbi:MAG TPA: calcium-binding protein [Rhizomicrobium sp.]|jgi:Ca2+-binding RTX toxin-like protein